MQSIHRAISATIVIVCLNACAKSDSEPAPPAPVDQTVFSDVVAPMEKARGVEETLLRQREELDRAVNESENE
jgi:hypothetical protein